MDHAAFQTRELDKWVDFFMGVFDMTITQRAEGNGLRKIWLSGGIQLNENPQASTDLGAFDHIALTTKTYEQTIQRSLDAGCVQTPAGPNWVRTPFGMVIEILEEK